jgi:hypothetical protein
MNKILLMLFIFVSCGKRSNECQSRQEAILRCQADQVQRYHPGIVPSYEMVQCENNHLVESCY